jgi:TetR/AcrR family transcriptional regulator
MAETMGEATRERVERLLDAAEAEFAAHGFASARLEDIAAAGGMRRASLLYHFPSKQALYDRVLERAFSALRARIVVALERPTVSWEERLLEAVRRSVDDLFDRPNFARLLLRDMLDGAEVAAERARLHVRPLLAIGEAFLEAGRSAGAFRHDADPRGLLHVFLGAVLLQAAQPELVRRELWGDLEASAVADRARAAALSMASATLLGRGLAPTTE